MLICPVCGKELVYSDKRYACESGHSFDVAKEGYVNLLLANQKRSAEPGDPKASLLSRRDLLNSGAYEPLSDKINEIVLSFGLEEPEVLDAGTGTGYYLRRLREAMPKAHYSGIDIGKEEAKMTARQNKGAVIAAASVFRLPFSEDSFDVLMSVFTPYSAQEFQRVVKAGGYVLAVQPGAKHLYELKEVVYRDPYENEEKGYLLPGFRPAGRYKVSYQRILSPEQINALWNMTPYAYKTSPEDQKKLTSMTSTLITIEFLISVYQKEGPEL